MSTPTKVTDTMAKGMLGAISGASTFSVFSEEGALPGHLSIEGLVAWLSTKMKQTDEEIRGRMSEVNDQKDAEKKLHALISELQGCVKKDAAGGMVDVPLDLGDKKKVHDSKLYKSLDAEGKQAIDALLDKVSHKFEVTENTMLPPGAGSGTPTFLPAGTVFDSGQYGEYTTRGLKDSQFKVLPDAKMSNDDLETSIKSLTEAASALGSNDEVNMIGLQSQISARAQLVQLVSNMISSVTDTNRSIIQNCKV
jgi:hypothetical protein